MKRLIGVRRSNNAFSRGTLSFIRPGEPHGALLRPAIRERNHRVRRQPVALGAGRRDRPLPVEGPRAAGDARAHGVSAASASCPISSRCRLTASSGSCWATRRSRTPKRGSRRARPSRWCGRTTGNRRWRCASAMLSNATCCRTSCSSAAGSPTRPAACRRPSWKPHSAGARRRSQRHPRLYRRSRRATVHIALSAAADGQMDALRPDRSRARPMPSPRCAAARARAR